MKAGQLCGADRSPDKHQTNLHDSPVWGNFLTLTRMGDSLVGDFGDGVFVGARASQHHTRFLIMTTIKTDYNNTELLNQELNFDELQEANGDFLTF